METTLFLVAYRWKSTDMQARSGYENYRLKVFGAQRKRLSDSELAALETFLSSSGLKITFLNFMPIDE